MENPVNKDTKHLWEDKEKQPNMNPGTCQSAEMGWECSYRKYRCGRLSRNRCSVYNLGSCEVRCLEREASWEVILAGEYQKERHKETGMIKYR